MLEQNNNWFLRLKSLKVTKKEKENYYPNNSISISNGLTSNINSQSNLINGLINCNYKSVNNQNVEEVNVTIRRNEKGFGFEVSGGTRIIKVNLSKCD